MKKKLLVTLIFLIGILSFSAGNKNLYYVNENGNLAISKKVLNEFKKLKDVNGIEWDRSDKSWVKN